METAKSISDRGHYLIKNNKCEENINKNQIKSLYSPFLIKKKPFQSVYPCKKSNEKQIKNFNSFYTEPFGPLIVTHLTQREKVKTQSKKFRFEEEPIKRFTYFEDHKDCKETELLWRDIQHPIILRYLSNTKEKNINSLNAKKGNKTTRIKV